MSDVLSARHRLEFPYRRSVGPVLGRFLAGLREGRIEGIRAHDGRVLVPPQEYDPLTAEPLDQWVPVGPEGVVVSWAWVAQPLPGQPLERPFAWALIRLDGADTSLLHAVDAGGAERMRTGMRVSPRWRPERVGDVRDIQCFELVSHRAASGLEGGIGDSSDVQCSGLVSPPPPTPSPAGGEGGALSLRSFESVRSIRTPVSLEYRYVPGVAASRFLRGVAEGRLIGQRCPVCSKVYVPPRGSCPTDGVPTVEEVELGDRGVVTTFCVVNVPFSGHAIEMPYVAASILLDGADIAFQHLIQGIPADQVRIGMRVEAVWRPREEWGPSLENISHFRPCAT